MACEVAEPDPDSLSITLPLHKYLYLDITNIASYILYTIM